MRKLILSILTVLILTSECAIFAAECSVRVRVWDYYGNSIEQAEAKLVGSKTLDRTPLNTPFEIDCGRYTLEVQAKGLAPFARTVDITHRNQELNATLRLGALEGRVPPCGIAVKLLNVRDYIQVRLLHLLADVDIEGAPDPTGAYYFSDLSCGDFLLIFHKGARCVATQPIRATMAGARLEVDAKTLDGSCSALSGRQPPIP